MPVILAAIFFYKKKSYVLDGQGQVFEYKCTVPCWLLFLAFLRRDCAPSSVMSVQVSYEAATSRAEVQE